MPGLTLWWLQRGSPVSGARPTGTETRRPAPVAGVGSPQGASELRGTFGVRRVRHGPGRAASPVRSGAETRRGAAQMSAGAGSALTCPRQERSPSPTRRPCSRLLEGRRPEGGSGGAPGEECPRPPAAALAVLPPHSRQPTGPAPKRQL